MKKLFSLLLVLLPSLALLCSCGKKELSPEDKFDWYFSTTFSQIENNLDRIDDALNPPYYRTQSETEALRDKIDKKIHDILKEFDKIKVVKGKGFAYEELEELLSMYILVSKQTIEFCNSNSKRTCSDAKRNLEKLKKELSHKEKMYWGIIEHGQEIYKQEVKKGNK